MKILYDYYPKIGDTSSASISSSSNSPTFFGPSNLFKLEPVCCFKTLNTNAFYIDIVFDNPIEIDTLFLNRINFSSYSIYLKNYPSTEFRYYTTIENLKCDEINDEQYIHNITIFDTIRKITAVRIFVESNVALFEKSYYKIGNIFMGKSVDMMNPKNGFTVNYVPNISITSFKSGHISYEKLGRTRRSFDGNFDKIDNNILSKFRLTYQPVVLYLDYANDTTLCYLVMNTKEFSQSYDYASVKSMTFTFEELV